MNLKGLVTFCKEKINKYPGMKSDIVDLYRLAEAECEDGGSEEHECELAVDSINDLIDRGSKHE